MGRKHRNPWGGPPIDDLALNKHYNRDGSKLTVEQVAGAWLRPIYTFPPQPGDSPNWRFIACWDDRDEPLVIGVENYGVKGREVIKHAMPLSQAGMRETPTGAIRPGAHTGGKCEQT